MNLNLIPTLCSEVEVNCGRNTRVRAFTVAICALHKVPTADRIRMLYITLTRLEDHELDLENFPPEAKSLYTSMLLTGESDLMALTSCILDSPSVQNTTDPKLLQQAKSWMRQADPILVGFALTMNRTNLSI